MNAPHKPLVVIAATNKDTKEKTAKEMKARLYAAIDAPHQFVKDQMVSGRST